MDAESLILSEQAQRSFWPTPAWLGDKLLEGISWHKMHGILEPSAGKGDLIAAVYRSMDSDKYLYERQSVDCIEPEPYLQDILRNNWLGSVYLPDKYVRKRELQQEWDFKSDAYREKYVDVHVGTPEYERLMAEEREANDEIHKLEKYLRYYNNTNVRVVHDDFLTFGNRSHYDLIVMNPPFSNGDEHLLHAIKLQEEFGGKIRCILNADTIRNPYTAKRQLLLQKLNEYEADIEYVDNAFSNGERKTDVSVALIRIDIPFIQRESEIFQKLREAAEVESFEQKESTDLTATDFLERIIGQYNLEVSAGFALIRQFVDMQPYILESFTDKEPTPLLWLSITGARNGYADDPKRMAEEYVTSVRHKYWEALFHKKEFVGTLTSDLQKRYAGMVDRMRDYDFTMFNIKQLTEYMNQKMSNSIQATIVELFDTLTDKYSWRNSEYEKNKHYFNGWCTNKAHMINTRVILPINGSYATSNWDRNLITVDVEYTLSDIQKVFDYFGSNDAYTEADLHGMLEHARTTGINRNIHCKYFDVDIFKKGTIHIKFRDKSLVDRFNIFCCRNKKWLPPCYGKKVYTEMTDDEKAVIDSFHGDGTNGSGMFGYSEVMNNTQLYLQELGTNTAIKLLSDGR